MKLSNNSFLLLFICMMNITALRLYKDTYQKCIEMKNKYPSLNLHCEKMNTKEEDNSFILNAFNKYKTTINQMYSKIKMNNDYNEFIDIIKNRLIEKQRNNSPKFLQINTDEMKRNFTALLDVQRENDIAKYLLNRDSNNTLIKDMQNEYKKYQSNNILNVYSNIDSYYYSNLKDHLNDESIKSSAERLQRAIKDYAKKNAKKYKPTGILTPNGKIEKEFNDKLIDEYKKEMTMKDIEKMMNIS